MIRNKKYYLLFCSVLFCSIESLSGCSCCKYLWGRLCKRENLEDKTWWQALTIYRKDQFYEVKNEHPDKIPCIVERHTDKDPFVEKIYTWATKGKTSLKTIVDVTRKKIKDFLKNENFKMEVFVQGKVANKIGGEIFPLETILDDTFYENYKDKNIGYLLFSYRVYYD